MRSLPIEPRTSRAAIGKRLRAVRQAQRLTIDQVAIATGLTKGFISRVERDQTSMSVASLVAVCEVLSLPVGSLFETPAVHLIKNDTGPRINLGGVGAVERLVTPRDEDRLQVIHSKYEPGGSGGDELYSVNSDIDVLHVIEGSITLRVPDASWVLESGDTTTFNGREPHSWTADETHGAEVIWVLAPAAWSGTI